MSSRFAHQKDERNKGWEQTQASVTKEREERIEPRPMPTEVDRLKQFVI